MPAGVYLHIPFCKSRCSYCDFATDVYRSNDVVERYVSALTKEIRPFNGISRENLYTGASKFKRSTPFHPVPPVPGVPGVPGVPPFQGGTERNKPAIDSIYFGGGTPSLLKTSQVEQILAAVYDKFDVAPNTEITMEMNPATVTRETIAAFRSLGINRASFGVQTFNERDLKLLARGHDADDARNTFRLLRDAGFGNISFDLIAGLPGQSLDDWRQNLDEAVAMQPEHLSLYLLEIHEGTPLAGQLRSGRRPMPDEDLAAEMYEVMVDRLAAAGYEQYEISNFAKASFQSRHNAKYWRLEPVYGFGASAHSFDGFRRYSNENDTAAYVKRIEEFSTAEVTRERIDAASEFLFLRLRLTVGVCLGEYQKRFGIDVVEKYADEIGRLEDAGLIDVSDDRLRLTRKGMLFSNEVFEIFV